MTTLKSEEEMVRENIALVNHVLKKYVWFNAEYEDMFQIGCIGLLKAVRGFDSGKGVEFSTFAVLCIKATIYKHIRHMGAQKRQVNDVIVSLDKLSEENTSLHDILPEDRDCIADVDNSMMVGQLIKAASLTEREFLTIKLTSQGVSQKEIGKVIGTSQVQASRIYRGAVKKMRKFMRG